MLNNIKDVLTVSNKYTQNIIASKQYLIISKQYIGKNDKTIKR